MLVPNQKIEITWRGNNKDYYISKGYAFTGFGKKIEVCAEDLSSKNSHKIYAKCDICEDIKYISFGKYNENIEHNNGKYVCHKCSAQVRHNRTLNDRQRKYYDALLKVCKENNYALLSDINEIKNNRSYIMYSCLQHGKHSMRVANMLSGERCPDCKLDNASKKYRLDYNDVERRIKNCGGTLLNKDKYVNQKEKNLKVLCGVCGNEFITSLNLFTQHGGQVCTNCAHLHSQGERKIFYYLQNNNIDFEREKRFDDCKDKRTLPFDFYLPEYNMCIEYDGQQHYNDGFFPTDISYTKSHDDIKTEFCSNNNIRLLRIPYWELNNINSILNNELHKDIV